MFINFEWDDKKSVSNIRKHKINFIEAKSVFYDQNARLIEDTEHSQTEQRFVLIGMSANFKVITVVHCVRNKGNIIRIISARKATKNEEKTYWEFIK